MSCLFVFNILDDMTHSNKNNGKLIVGAGAMADSTWEHLLCHHKD